VTDETPRYTELANSGNTWDAHMCAEFLRSNGIDAHLLNDQHNSMEPYLAQMVPVRVMVPTDELDRANRLLEDLENAPTEDIPELRAEDDATDDSF